MKAIIFSVSILFSVLANAQILNSSLEDRHQKAIIEAVQGTCGYFGDFEQNSNTVREERIDQGIMDLFYTTQLTVKVPYEQMMFDVYDVKVESMWSDQYDHNDKVWGSYSVLNVLCH